MRGMEELIQALNRLLEAERAGVEALVDLTRMSADVLEREMLQRMGGDEAWACISLREQIEALGGTPGRRIGPLLAEMRACDHFAVRLQLFARQQQAVLESLSGLLRGPPLPEAVRELLVELYRVHVPHIAWCEQRATALGVRDAPAEGSVSGRVIEGRTSSEGREATQRKRNKRQAGQENRRSEAGRAEAPHRPRLINGENDGADQEP